MKKMLLVLFLGLFTVVIDVSAKMNALSRVSIHHPSIVALVSWSSFNANSEG
ncbi:hypothetical protein HOM50_03180 [bacterium]|nr:hypothetical protein [bacterium]MBT5015379.1 hypothetical protein [bacterium]